ncbi:MAG: hypothetical protein EOO61_01370 [Hymenobacter sp.]|nr:MAG: hypothetical protein EOO61_01370 [Hymenobacter sp.]
MNIAQAKEIPLETILRHLGAEESKASADRSEIWFKSPLREEKTASFKIDVNRNQWYDHGQGVGGDIIKLVTTCKQMTVSEALKWIKSTVGQLPPQNQIKRTTAQPRAEKQPVPQQADLLLVKEKELTTRALLDYIQRRGIDRELAIKHCQEIHYKSPKVRANLYGIGFKNDAGGHEVRAAIGDFKSVIGHKDITTIYPKQPAASLDVFEGYFDYLTRLQMGGIADDQAFIVLNTASLAKRGIDQVKNDPALHGVQLVRTWFDNDQRGEEITHEYALALHESHQIGDMRENYKGPDKEGNICKDLNKWWTDCPAARHGQAQKVYYEDPNEGRNAAITYANRIKPAGWKPN